MKKPLSILMIPFLFTLVVSCSSGSSGGGSSDAEELTLQKRTTGAIAAVGDVKWYHYRAVETNNILQVKCVSETLRPDVDLLVTIYQVDSQGNRSILYGDHAPEGSANPADLTLYAYIDRPKDIYIAVRDYRDDDASDKPFYLTIDYAGTADGDNSFSQATSLTVGNSSCPTNTIGYVCDTDCYRFTSAGGIYDINATFSAFSGTQVQLQVALYDGNGNLMETQTGKGVTDFHLTHFLNAGDYYVLVNDYGKDHFDNASTYKVCINPVDGTEAHGNDTPADATAVDTGDYNQPRTIQGSLDYSEDKDYYALQRPSSTSGFQVVHLDFTGTARIKYQVSIVDEGGAILMTHAYSGGSAEYHTQVRLGSSEYYLLVQPCLSQKISQSAPYTAIVTMLDVVDPAEESPDNNTIGTADPLAFTSNPASATPGKISYRGDVDFYSVSIPAHAQPQVLEVFFEAPVSEVEYCLNVMGTQLEKTLTNQDAEAAATDFKTSLLIPASSSAAVYSFKVSDYQDDEGYDATYFLRADIKDVPAALPALGSGTPPYGLPVNHYSEAAEGNTSSVTLEYNSVTRKTFGVNTALLDFAGATVQNDTPSAGLTTVTLPWIAGYVDYQGDQDWFLIDFQPLDTSTNWYYDISVEMYAPATDVEYVWKFYPDRNDNAVVADRTSGYDGFIASAGDRSISAQVLDIVTPAAGESRFWVGNPWRGPAYFSVSDFNYLYDQGGNENTEPDEDWGGYGSAPYYFRVTLVYHPGVSYP